MDLDELFPDKPDDPLTLLDKQDLDPLSVEELHERIAILEAEIARVQAKIDAAVNHPRKRRRAIQEMNGAGRNRSAFSPAFDRRPCLMNGPSKPDIETIGSP